jgi:AP endonuclease-1
MAGTPKSKKRAARSDISPPPKRTKKVKVETTEINQVNGDNLDSKLQTPKKRSKKVKSEVVTNSTVKTEISTTEVEIQDTPSNSKKTKRTKKTTTKVTEGKEMIRATRTLGTKILVGAHVSAAGGMSLDNHNSQSTYMYLRGA